jgi:hypothetical protein
MTSGELNELTISSNDHSCVCLSALAPCSCCAQGKGDRYWYGEEPQYYGEERYYQGPKDEEREYYPKDR